MTTTLRRASHQAATGALSSQAPANVFPPRWASTWGDDEYGVWADLTINSATQRLRWIAPGEFWMGSPDDEPGRFDNEGPRHRVRINQGFWLSDTPCTQGFWRAWTGESPSHFKGEDDLPVERVSWDDVQGALPRLAAMLPPGVQAVLPSEADWEYAARAGTDSKFNVGDRLDRTHANFGDQLGKTCVVKNYAANSWGLYDSHGQVWEWCADGLRNYGRMATPGGLLLDPKGEAGPGVHRAVRGGSWGDGARFARSAYRLAGPSGGRIRDLGFRFALRSTSPGGPEGPSSPGTGR